MKLQLLVHIPDSAAPDFAFAMLEQLSDAKEGITITTPQGVCLDVDLREVVRVRKVGQ